MPQAGQDPRLIDRSVFDSSKSGSPFLSNKLPKDAVIGLAQELVLRLSTRAEALDRVVTPPSSDEIDTLAHALVSFDENACIDLIAAVRRDGASLEVVYLAYLARAARRLGEWWEDDRITFVDVTIGAGRIYAIMRGLRQVFLPSAPPRNRSMVLALVPGEIHTLGIAMAADLFRSRGWDVEVLIGRTHEELIADIERSNCVAVGLSATNSRHAVALARLVVGLRLSVPEAGIFVGGRIVEEKLAILESLDVDAMTTDVNSAIAAVEAIHVAASQTRQ